jgi:3-oxoacyl-[acyl-carrier-protein] synthase II
MAVYINGIGSISAQRFESQKGFLSLDFFEGNKLTCQEPDYKELIPPMQLRRMTKVVRMGIASAKSALNEAGLERPDIITTGTAYGCLADTELFLSKLLTQEESMLTPTAFIQSTHNTVSGQIALNVACHGHNFTYVHRGHSFETSLQESLMWLAENPALSILTGGVDELTQHSFDIISRFGTYKTATSTFDEKTEGTIAGEGSSMFVLSTQKQASTYAELVDVCLCKSVDIPSQLNQFLSQQHLSADQIDLCLVGVNGDTRYDSTILNNVSVIGHSKMATFKKWCGEFPTSGSFALAMALSCIRQNYCPSSAMLQGDELASPKTVLIYNHYKNQYHSFILLRAI